MVNKTTRRDFLKFLTHGLLTLSGLLGLGVFLRFLDHPTEPSPKMEFDLGPASNYPIGSRTVLPDIPAILIHNESGFTVLSLVCTHLGCTLESKDDGFACPCHGSHFYKDGEVRNGPADRPLRTLRLDQTPDGELILHTD